MTTFKASKKYRDDIDGLRAIAVIAVILFHIGYLKNGFLGVDIFFVISGYLITNILYTESVAGQFSMVNFYLRRVRRIIPLVLTFCLMSLLLGTLVMLPDDLENLAQSIIATLLFSNNILLCITTGNYWEVINEFKPLMHTWSLGIEEQFYALYPFLFLLLKKKLEFVLPCLFFLTIFSLYVYFNPFEAASKFYLLPFRFFELSVGGLGALLFVRKQIHFKYRLGLLILLLSLLCFEVPFLSHSLLIPFVCLTTALLLISYNNTNQLCSIILENQLARGIGKISFSLYMWHQFLLAFVRYFVTQDLTPSILCYLLFALGLLSFLTYKVVETPFRNKQLVHNRTLLTSVGIVSLLLLGASFYIYNRAGVLKDVQALNISKTKYERNMHAKYVKRVDLFEQTFLHEDKIKVLVYGNSFARDWTNVLLESKYNTMLDVVCINKIERHPELAKAADIIFLAKLSKLSKSALSINQIQGLDESITKKIWCVGTKNFGISNGVFYNYSGEDFCLQRTRMEKGYLAENKILKAAWENRYIDLIGLLLDEAETVPVFTPDCKFISQDTRHLTQPGARYMASLADRQLQFIFGK